MPRYFFDINMWGHLISDKEGSLLPEIHDAEAEVRMLVRELAAGTTREEGDLKEISVSLRDGDDNTLTSLSVADYLANPADRTSVQYGTE